MLSFRRMVSRRSKADLGSRRAVKARPCLESLESRVVLYSATGNLWPQPQVVTISFVPDGTDLGGVASNLFSAFNSRPQLAGRWQAQILKAAQVWAQQTNINFVVVTDNGAPVGSGGYQQGDPGFGDIRIGGYAFGTATLARANMPPAVNNFSIAGDVSFNTAQAFNIGTTHDLFTVAAHELGHALGLGHTNVNALQVMYGVYNGVKAGLNSDDIAGIRGIYGAGNPRSPDANDAAASNSTFATATNVNTSINATTMTATVPGLDLTTTADLDYYSFNAPSQTTGTLTLNVQSSGLSLLSPKVTVYAADQTTILGSANGLNQTGTTLTVTVPGVYAGQQFFVKVQGADTTAFSTGAYALTLNFGNGPSPTVPLPQTQTPNSYPLHVGGGLAITPSDHDHDHGHNCGQGCGYGHGHGDGHQTKKVDPLPTVIVLRGDDSVPQGPAIFDWKGQRRQRHPRQQPWSS